MPASLPGATTAQNQGNPSQAPAVTFDLMSGPKGSPFDKDATGNNSTGGLSTGIGFGSVVIGPTAPASISAAGFTDDYVPGVTKPDGTASTNSTYMYIGGGRTNIVGNVPTTVPYTAGFGIGMAGGGGARDAGAGPAFTGFTMKMVTATASVANGAAVETGFTNRAAATMASGQSTFGSSGTASAAPAMVEENGAEDRQIKREFEQQLERELEAEKPKGRKS